MATIRLLLLAVLCAGRVAAAEDGPAWRNDLDAALDQSAGQPLALLVTSAGCVWCHRMLEESDASADVRQALHEVVGVTVEAEQHRSLIARLGITSFPTLVLVNRKQELVRMVAGYVPAVDLVTTLRVLALHGDEDGQRPAGLRGALDVAAIRAAPDGVARLVELLGSGPAEQRAQVREALAAMPAASEALWPRLDDEHLGVRVDAAAVLARVAGDPPGYDPFAPAAERAPAIAAWRARLALPGGALP